MDILYFDMDGVLADFGRYLRELSDSVKDLYNQDAHEMADAVELRLFRDLKPIEGSIEAVKRIMNSGKFECYVLSTVPHKNPMAYVDKSNWLLKYLPDLHDKFISSQYKNLNMGKYLIDDRTKNGAGEFTGEHIHFGPDGKFGTWYEVLEYLGV